MGNRCNAELHSGILYARFFVATGYCTNFTTSFAQYVGKNLKTIMWPCFCLYYFNHLLSIVYVLCFEDSTWVTFSNTFSPGIRTFFQKGGFYWFLTALFVAKILYYLVCKISPQLSLRLFISIVLMETGVYCNIEWPDLNYFYWQHALVLLVFLPIGQLLCNYHNRIIRWGGHSLAIYLFIVKLFSCIHTTLPSITRTFDVKIVTLPIYLSVASLGTLGIWWLSERIEKSTLLEYWGRNTIVIYAFNYIASCLVSASILYFARFLCEKFSYIFFWLVVFVSMTLLSWLSWLFNRKCLKVLLGKF